MTTGHAEEVKSLTRNCAFKDLTGQRFGTLVALHTLERSKSNKTMWSIRCDCGEKIKIQGSNLLSGHTKTCGDTAVHKPRRKDFTGQRFGTLVVVSATWGVVGGRSTKRWNVVCDCGKTSTPTTTQLLSGHTKTCGDKTIHKSGTNSVMFKDLSGKKFGKLTVISYAGSVKVKGHGSINWNCVCECGNKTQQTTAQIKERGSCGCWTWVRGDVPPYWVGNKNRLFSREFFSRAVTGAKERGFDFLITPYDIVDLYEKQKHRCAITGVDIFFADSKNKGTASIDRIDSSLGYIKENIQLLHKDINIMKLDHDQDYFIKLCKLVAENNPSLTS